MELYDFGFICVYVYACFFAPFLAVVQHLLELAWTVTAKTTSSTNAIAPAQTCPVEAYVTLGNLILKFDNELRYKNSK